MTTTTAATVKVPAKPAAGCGGDGCDALDPWPLHHVRHRSIFCRLCTSCVLKYHPGSFCALCFALLDATSPPAIGVAHCSKCPSVSHLACLPSPDLAPQFLCPSCKHPEGFAYFPKENRSIDFDSARVLLAASRLSAISMSKASALMKVDVERKVKESALARKRAREMLERTVAAHKKEEKNVNGDVVNSKATGAEELKKKMVKAGAGVVDHKRPQSREIEKWMSIHKPILKGENDDKSKVGGVGEVKGEKKDRKETLLSCQSIGGIKEEEKSTKLPQSTQDALVSKTNPRLNTHEFAKHI